MKYPKVSICIPAYKQAENLERCLMSIINQKYNNYEIVITDDSPNDSVKYIVNKYANDKRIKYFKNINTIGSPGNWNEAIDKARGEYIKIIHNDDWLSDNESLGKYVEAMEKYPGIDFAFSSSAAFKQNKLSYIHTPSQKHLMNLNKNVDTLLYGNIIGAPSATIHRKSKIRYDTKLKWLVDIDYYIRFLKSYPKYVFIPEPLINITTDGKGQISRLCENDQDIDIFENLYVFNKLGKDNYLSIDEIEYISRLFKKYNIKRPSEVSKYYPNNNIPLNIQIALYVNKIKAILLSNRYIPEIYMYKNRLIEYYNNSKPKISYSQCGEDIIVKYIFNCLSIDNPKYLDIGAYHPSYLSNTYLFYQEGKTGVCIEPDPDLFNYIKKKRPKDICLNIGITNKKSKYAIFYVMNEKSLNTFSYVEAKRLENEENKIILNTTKIPMMSVNDVIKNNFTRTLNYLSIDIEGLDLSVLKSLDFNSYRPEVIVAETLTYSEGSHEHKLYEITEFMQSKGYFVYADTFINTIYVDKVVWDTRNI